MFLEGPDETAAILTLLASDDFANVTASPKISSGLAVTDLSLELALCETKQRFFNLLQICCQSSGSSDGSEGESTLPGIS